MSGSAGRKDESTLPRDLSEFLVEFGVALHKHAMYPSGHLALEPAAAAVARRAGRILTARQRIAFGAARHQLIIDGVATDPDHPVLRRLAERLHRHNLGAVSLFRGLHQTEIAAALHALAVDPERDGPLGLAADRLPVWPHLRLHPLTFDRLTLVGDAPIVADGSGGSRDCRAAELWIGLARAAMVCDAAADPVDVVPTEPAVVARAIDEHPGAEAYDQVIVGYLLQIARELKGTTGSDTAALRQRTGRLIAALKPETLRRLVEMGGDAAQRGAFVLDAAHGMAVDAVLEILKAAAAASGQTISHGLLRMLSKLAAHAELGQEQARPAADLALREEVSRLVTGWNLADPNPAAYSQLLQNIAAAAPATQTRKDSDEDPHQQDPLRVVKMSLEIGTHGPLVDRAVDRAVDHGVASKLLQLLTAIPGGRSTAADAVRDRLRQPVTIGRLMSHEPIDFESLDQLLTSLPLDAYKPLLDTLAASDNRATRRKLLDRLSHTDVDIAPLIDAALEDDRWFVQRNMLVLLERSGRAPAGFSALRWTAHPDPRVRHAAIRLQLTLPQERDLAVSTALADDDPRLVRVGLIAVQEDCPPAVADLVVGIAETPKHNVELRTLAARALGRCRDVRALHALLRLVYGGKTLLGRQRLAPRTPVLLAALETLADAWSADPRARSMLAIATRSSDPEVRQAGGGDQR